MNESLSLSKLQQRTKDEWSRRMNDEKSREKLIVRAGIIGIVTNLVLAFIKVVIGSFTASIAIISDATNNLSDAASSVITIIGSKLAAKDPDEKHPYGYGRIEYITALVISIIIIVVGLEFLKTSFLAILNPNSVTFTWITILIMLITIFAKIWLSNYNKSIGKRANSPALVASGAEALGDAAVTSLTVIAAIFALLTGIHVDGYVGILVSAFILYSGLRLVMDTFNDIIGKRGDEELANEIYQEIEQTELIKGAYDLILHNYGPNRHLGSVNVEIEDFHTIREASELLMPLQSRIGEKFGVFLVFGFYSVNTSDEKVIHARTKISNILKKYPAVMNMHAFFIDNERKFIKFDIIVTFQLKDARKLKDWIISEIEQVFPGFHVLLNMDHRYS